LSSVLKGVEPEISELRRLGVARNSEDSAHFVLSWPRARGQVNALLTRGRVLGDNTAMPPIQGGRGEAVSPRDQSFDPSDRFSDRARALFYARLAFLGIGLGVLGVPSWAHYVGATGTAAFVIYFAVIGYSVANYLLLDHPRIGRPLTFFTLTVDLFALTTMVMSSGGLKSPMMAAQVMFTIFFALLFPRPLTIVPPLLMLPVVARLDYIAEGRTLFASDVFLLVWYAALNFIAVYVLVYLNTRDQRHLTQLRELTHMREEAIITEERLRLAREIHDGLGGTLSTLIIQSEYIYRMANEEPLRQEIADLKSQAEEAIEELRRSLTMMRRDFDLHKALEDYCTRFTERSKVPAVMKVQGRRRRLPSEMQLAVFRILQECLTNIQKHAKAQKVEVTLKYDGDLVSITISDDGVGFDRQKAKPGHYGLTNILERARKFRGTVDVQSAPGAGTTVHASLAIPAEGSHIALMPTPQETPATA
jgi:two-component system, NarL family, sensor histidine kinase DegS